MAGVARLTRGLDGCYAMMPNRPASYSVGAEMAVHVYGVLDP